MRSHFPLLDRLTKIFPRELTSCQMATQTQPLVYVLHGAWHGPAYFDTVRLKFQALGYTMVCPQQPSTGALPPTKTLHDDAAHVRAELELLIEHGQEVVLVMHSYGGMVGTQAAAGLGKVERARRGQTGGIVRLFYACSFMLPLGSDLCNGLGGKLPPWIIEEVGVVGIYSSRMFSLIVVLIPGRRQLQSRES